MIQVQNIPFPLSPALFSNPSSSTFKMRHNPKPFSIRGTAIFSLRHPLPPQIVSLKIVTGRAFSVLTSDPVQRFSLSRAKEMKFSPCEKTVGVAGRCRGPESELTFSYRRIAAERRVIVPGKLPCK